MRKGLFVALSMIAGSALTARAARADVDCNNVCKSAVASKKADCIKKCKAGVAKGKVRDRTASSKAGQATKARSTLSGVKCGKKICPAGYQCCDPRCSYCDRADTVCSDKDCTDPEEKGTSGAPSCKSWKCAANQKCVQNGPAVLCVAANCAGMPTCDPGKHCEMVAGSPKCVPGAPTGRSSGPVRCGKKTCPAGQVCCNSSCGICTPPNGTCTDQDCKDPDG
jgi:hypothetical protein